VGEREKRIVRACKGPRAMPFRETELRRYRSIGRFPVRMNDAGASREAESVETSGPFPRGAEPRHRRGISARRSKARGAVKDCLT